MKHQQVYTSYNPFFLIPFLLWVVTGGLLLGNYDKRVLFLSINSRYNELLDVMMAGITFIGEGYVIIPVLLLLPLLIKKLRNLTYIFAAITGNIGAFILSQTLKSYFNEPRPLTYFEPQNLVRVAEGWEQYYHRSFPSGHTTGAFAFLCFLSLFLSQRHRAWGLVFFLMAMAVAYSRIYLAAHFFLDVYAGSIIGTVFSIFAVFIFYKAPYRTKISG